jgi:excisionase family DNA binding protein
MKNENFVQIMQGIRVSLALKKPILNQEEAAMFLGVQKSYLYKLTCNRQIKFHRSKGGKLLYFKKVDLLKWMLHQEVKTFDQLKPNKHN